MWEWTASFVPANGKDEYIRSGGRATFDEALEAACAAVAPVEEWDTGTWEINVRRSDG